VVGFTGRFSEAKGLHVLIAAVALVLKDNPRIRLLLVGDGSLRRELEAQIQSLNLSSKVIITGLRSDIPQLLRAMDVFVMTSLWEGLSRSLAEAMFAKVPVIATDVGGTSDAVRPRETGWLIEPNSPRAAADAICEAIQNPDRATVYAKNAFQWARGAFDIRKMHSRIDEIYSAVVAPTADVHPASRITSPEGEK